PRDFRRFSLWLMAAVRSASRCCRASCCSRSVFSGTMMGAMTFAGALRVELWAGICWSGDIGIGGCNIDLIVACTFENSSQLGLRSYSWPQRESLRIHFLATKWILSRSLILITTQL